jgi:hypothetical protein
MISNKSIQESDHKLDQESDHIEIKSRMKCHMAVAEGEGTNRGQDWPRVQVEVAHLDEVFARTTLIERQELCDSSTR